MTLAPLFHALAEVFDSGSAIETAAASALRKYADAPVTGLGRAKALAAPFVEAMTRPDAHPVCQMILNQPFEWVPPQTSSDPAYQKVGHTKAHVELLGPGGLIETDEVRLGLYGILPHAEYGIRTHPAEEVFVMLAGEALWKRGAAPYLGAGPGERSHHPSMLPHATRTTDQAFMSAYVWWGDISTENYVYSGVPKD